jgi:anti-sigma regulatory factor (Ser/Thr protein kinase)/ActR/RegA family two-component response regulator
MNSAPQLEAKVLPQKLALFVDVEEKINSILEQTLDPALWSIRHAPDNISALALAEGTRFDLILTSEKTPAKADVELLRRIRRVRPHTRLIILATESTPADVITSMRERAFSYFSTPISIDSLVDMVRAAAEGPCWDDGIEIKSATPDWIRILARCDLNTADRLIQFLGEIADLPETEGEAVGTAFREILMNAIEYGGHFRSDQYVEISYIRAKHMVMCRVKDPGEGFSLSEIEHAATANPDEDPIRHVTKREAKGLRPGGYGVLLVKELVDELIYSEKGNEVLLVKYLNVDRMAQ